MRRDSSEVAAGQGQRQGQGLADRPVETPVGYALLVQYRILAFSTATLLIVLVFVGIPLQLAAHRPGVVNLVGTLHGFLYLVYLVVAFTLTRKLKVPKWKMGLILLAGTVPFCAFIAERKVTKMFNAANHTEPPGEASERSASRAVTRIGNLQKRWLSRRALLLHFEVLIVAPGCVVAGWWQATRALAGNGLSWVYSVEWPLFALLAVWGWWHLIHEDPEAYRKRRMRATDTSELDDPGTRYVVADAAEILPDGEADRRTERDDVVIRSTRILAMLICAEFVLGFVALALVPFGRRSGWVPSKGEAVYLAHAIFGALLVCGATALLFRSRDCSRAVKLSGRFGFVGLMLAAIGGLLVEEQSLLRFFGMTLMLIGAALSVFGYMIPRIHSSSRALAAARADPDHH
jgi:integral membrane protein